MLSYEWLIEILKGLLEVVLVIAIVVGLIAIIYNATQRTPQDNDFKRILDASKSLMKDFENGKVKGQASFTVPIVSEDLFQVVFYPQKDTAVVPPPKCKGRTCICMYYVIADNKKETCKIIETKPECKLDTCGEELCPGASTQFVVKRGDFVRVGIDCTSKGSQLSVAKV